MATRPPTELLCTQVSSQVARLWVTSFTLNIIQYNISPYIKCVGCNACSRDWQHVTWWVIPVFLRLLMGVLVVLVLFYFVHCVTRTKQKTIENFVCRKRKYGTEFKYQFFRLYFLFQIACNCVQIIKSSVQCIFVSKVEEFPGQSPGLPLVNLK